MFDIETAAQHLGVSVKTVRRLVQDKELPAYRIGRQLRFKTEEIEAYLEAVRTVPRREKHSTVVPTS